MQRGVLRPENGFLRREEKNMQKIGILCASDTELEPFLPYIRVVGTMEKAMLKFYKGNADGVEVAAVYSGVGKVNAAIAAQLLIDAFHVTAVINGGTAGGIAEHVKLFDTVAAERTAFHDMDGDILTDFHPWLSTPYFPGDRELLERAREYGRRGENPLLFGTIVTGDRFITDAGREAIKEAFAPLAVDMESAAAAHVCYVNRIPFLSVRTITDTADHAGVENFEKNCEKASAISAQVVMGILKDLGK